MWFIPYPELHVSSPNQTGFSLLSVKDCYTCVQFIKSDNPTQRGYVPVSCRRDLSTVSVSVIFRHFTGNSFNTAFSPFLPAKFEVIQLLELLSRRELICGPSMWMPLLL